MRNIARLLLSLVLAAAMLLQCFAAAAVEPDDPTMYDPLVYPEYADPDFIASADGDDIWVDETVVPEDPVTGEPQAENVPESAEKAGDEAAPEVTDPAEGKAAPVDAESAAEERAEVKTEGEIADENAEHERQADCESK